MRRLFITFIIMSVTAMVLAGCGGGGSSGSGGDNTGSAETIADAATKIGMAECISCHVGAIADQNGQFTEAYKKWLVGPHGNFQYKVNEDDATAAQAALGYYAETSHGNRYYFTYNHYSTEADGGDATAYTKYSGYPYESMFSDPEECKTCHGPSDLDNEGVAELPVLAKLTYVLQQNTRGIIPDWDNELPGADNDDTIDWDTTKQAERLVIGCESCHGGGNMHQVDPTLLPEFKPGAETCADCHGPDHHHTNGDKYTEYAASPHARSLSGNTHIEADEDGKINYARCAKCHTDEGSKEYKDYDVDTYPAMATLFENEPKMTYADLSDITCATCHDAHNPHEFLEKPTVTAGVVTRSAEFNTCTNCHQYVNAGDDDLAEPYHFPITTDHPTASAYGAWDEVISDTHYDKTVKATAETITGYVIDFDATDSCSVCHNPHAADNTINEQWAESAHGGKIKTVKEAAYAADSSADLQDVEVTEDTAAAWAHYDFKDVTRQACQRCHTATGFSNFADDPTTYDQTANDFAATGDQREMLYCWGCHSDNAGTLRDPGEASVSLDGILYDAAATGPAQQEVNARIEAVGDLDASNTCVPCHSGRFTVPEMVESSYSDDNSLNGNSSGSGTHYKDTAGTIFRFAAYEMPGLDYDNPSYYKHDGIGTVDADGNEVYEGTGTAGPCVGCHMSAEDGDNHHFEPFDESEDSGVTPVCDTCHGSHGGMSTDVLTEEKEGFENAIEAMKFFIENNYAGANLTMLDSYPYVGYNTPTTWSTDFGANDKNAYGAAYNYVYIHHEGGAYAHNRYYAKRVIFDAIDLMDNGTFDGTIDLTGYAEAAAWYGGDDITAISRP